MIGGSNGLGGVVPWNVQCINSKPKNFQWEPDCDGITCVNPGLYEVTAGFFTDSVPKIRLLVNGESVLAAAAAATARCDAMFCYILVSVSSSYRVTHPLHII